MSPVKDTYSVHWPEINKESRGPRKQTWPARGKGHKNRGLALWLWCRGFRMFVTTNRANYADGALSMGRGCDRSEEGMKGTPCKDMRGTDLC